MSAGTVGNMDTNCAKGYIECLSGVAEIVYQSVGRRSK